MKVFFVLLLFCHVVSAERHSLKFFLTGTTGIPDFPEFVATATINGIQFGSFYSTMKTAKPTQDWARELIKNDPQHLEWYTHECFGIQHLLRVKTDELERQFNQSTGFHILQRVNGCEWDDETGETVGFDKYSFDREDLLALDLQTMTWIAPAYKAFAVKLRWDTEKARLNFYNHFYNYMCPQWLKKYVHFGRSIIQRTELPSVSLLQKSPSSPVTCHATGFYPDRALMFWTRDGEELFEETDYREILPNPDGTFQMSVELSISLVKTEDWGRYECVFQLSGVKEDIVTKLDKAAIRSNKGSGSPSGLVTGVIVGLLLLSVCITGLVIWRKKKNGFQLANVE